MTTADLHVRGFRRHGRLSTFFGFCYFCNTYRTIAWWQTPAPDNHQVAACDSCGGVDRRDAAWVGPRYPVLEARTA
jgi:hypothetical protein